MISSLENYDRSPYNSFRTPGGGFKEELLLSGSLSKTFDEPTYLTFRLKFERGDFDFYNRVDITDFDRIPMPLFSTYNHDIKSRNYYSTYQYLIDNNELVRSKMLLDFIEKWNDLQDNYQWYFQEISGLDSFLTVNTEMGRRVPVDAKITIKMLEGLDLRVTHLLDLYRRIAWDDMYQRWILPDIMRNFMMTIYITEYRSFHRPLITSKLMPGSETPPMILELIDNFAPVHVMELERCEFDITSIKRSPDILTVGESEMRTIEFAIKASNFKERNLNPLLNTFYHDLLINGYNRISDEKSPIKISDHNITESQTPLSAYAQGNSLAELRHESARPFIQNGYLDNVKNSSPNYDMDIANVNPIDPATWMGNALTAGKALVKNLVKSKVDEVKVKKIPGLGISFNEAISAIQSKNVFTLFGAARRALSDSIKNTLPSQELEKHFIDTQFRNYLKGIIASEATDDDALALQRAANLILNNKGHWDKIMDLSKATDLVSSVLGEINSQNKIENKDSLKEIYNQKYISTPIQGHIILEGIPSSATISDKKIVGQSIQRPAPSKATSGIGHIESGTTTDLGSTDGNLPAGSTINPSSQLEGNIVDVLSQPNSGLGETTEGNMTTAKPSELLGDTAMGGMIQPPIVNREIEGGKINIPAPSKATNNKLLL